MPEPVFANIGKLLLATQIYDMHRLAHEVSGGLIVALPGPDEDHNPATAARLSEVLRANPDGALRQAHRGRALHRGPDGVVPGRLVFGDQPARRRFARGDEAGDLAPLPVGNKVELVERLLERGVLRRATSARSRATAAGPLLRQGLHGAGSADDGAAADQP